MTQAELYTQLNTIGYPLAYHHFVVDEENPPPSIPNIVYLRLDDDNISSDFKVHAKFKYFNIELYTNIKDLDAEQKVEAVLNNIDSQYKTSEVYIESESIYQITYSIKILEKRKGV